MTSSSSSQGSTSSFEEHWLTGPHSTHFYCRTYSAPSPRATLVFLHGFIEHIGRYAHVFPRWQARGINVFAFDQRGFGKTAEDAEHRSPDSSYGKTCGVHQLEDAEWAVAEAKQRFGKELPTFVMGHSMGGGTILDFGTCTKQSIAGVISTSPLLLQTTAAPKIARWLGEKASMVTPYTTITAKVNEADLSRDPKCNEAYLRDPLVKHKGTLKGITDMFNRGEELLKTRYLNWPKELPLLIVHGTDDKVTSHAASHRFHDVVPATDKQILLYTGGYHELHNEPDGVKEKVIDDCISWVQAHLSDADSTVRTAKL